MRITKLFHMVALGAALFLAITIIIVAQFSISTLHGADGYLHIRMAEIIKQSGPIHNFHWARLSLFAQQFADKDFFYHLLLVPFTFFQNIFWGAKLSAVIFAILFLAVFVLILRQYAYQPLIPLFIVSLFLSDLFVNAMLRPRPMFLVIALTILAIHLLIKKRLMATFLLTVVYCLSHVSGPFMLLYAILIEAVRFIDRKEFYFKSIAVVLGGILLAYLVHPNFPHNILVFYLNAIIVPVYALRWRLELGAEFFPLSSREYLLRYPLLIIAILTLLALAIFSGTKTRFFTKVIFACTAVYFFFSFLSQRYIIHGYPLVLLLLGAYLKDYFQNKSWKDMFRHNKILNIGLIIAVSLIFFWQSVHTSWALRKRCVNTLIVNTHYENVAEFLRANVPPGELIFHANWSDSQYFIGLNPDNDYFVTLDPIYMYWPNPKLYNLYRDVAFGRTKDPYHILKHTFQVKYGYVGKNYFGGLIRQIKRDIRFDILAEDSIGLIFKLK